MQKVEQAQRVGLSTIQRHFLTAIISAVVTGLVALGGPPLFSAVVGPPSQETIDQVLNQSDQAAITRDADLVRQIYLPDAILVDAGCNDGTPGSLQGVDAIIPFYTNPQVTYVELQHFITSLQWNGQWRWEISEARVSTSGVDVAKVAHPDGTQVTEDVASKNQWTIDNVNGQWRIANFTFNVCT